MNVVLCLIGWLLGRRRLDGALVKSVLKRYRKNERLRSRFYLIAVNRVKFICDMLLFPVMFCFRLKRSAASVFFIDPSFKGAANNQRIDFIRKYAGINPQDEVQGINGSRIFFSSGERLAGRVVRLAGVWLKFLVASMRGPLNFDPIFLTNCTAVLNYLASAILIDRPANRLYVFYLFDAHQYLAGMLASELIRHLRVGLVTSSSALYGHNRYTVAPRADLILCSRFQEEEARHFEARGWIRVASVQLWGLEEVHHYYRLKPEKPAYDIGLFSSGTWARVGGLWRSEDIEAVRHYQFTDNALYRSFEVMMDEVLEAMKGSRLKVKIYTHPYERLLFSRHGIRPPYMDRAAQGGVDVDIGGENSIGKLYECRVGLGMASTIIFDRWHLGLTGYVYDDSLTLAFKFIEPRALPSYRRFILRNRAEMRQMLEEMRREAAGH